MIQTGQNISAADFVSSSAGAGDIGKSVKLNAQGKLNPGFRQVEHGGTGADGALTISSGTTTLDLGGSAVFIKNYSSISITGTGKLAFSNPHPNGTVIFLLCQGNFTATSSATPNIDASALGAAGGAAVTDSGAGSSGTTNGNDGSDGVYYSSLLSAPTKGTKATNSNGVKGSKPTLALRTGYVASITTAYILKYAHMLWTAAGSGSGAITHSTSSWGGTSGKGGRGGGTLVIEVGGYLNFTGSISVAGENGGNAGSLTGTQVGAGGGAGGAGGLLILLYNLLTANSGTVTKSGGSGGTSANTSHSANGGGSGANGISDGSDGTSSVTNGTTTGGAGPTGDSLVIQNVALA